MELPWQFYVCAAFTLTFVTAAFVVWSKQRHSEPGAAELRGYRFGRGMGPSSRQGWVQPYSGDMEEVSFSEEDTGPSRPTSEGSRTPSRSSRRAAAHRRPEKPPAPQYGVFAYPVVAMFIRLGLSVNVTSLVYGLALLPFSGEGTGHEGMERAFFSMSVAVYNVFFLYLTLSFLSCSFGAQRPVVRGIIDRVGLDKCFGSVLVTSTFRGSMASIIAKHVPGCIVVTSDPWESPYVPMTQAWAVENMFREQVQNRVRVTYGDPRNLPHDDKSFDWVVCPRVLFFVFPIEDHEQILRECKRVLKPGGQLLSFYASDRIRDLAEKVGLGGGTSRWFFSLPWPSRYFVAGRRIGSFRPGAGGGASGNGAAGFTPQLNFNFNPKRAYVPAASNADLQSAPLKKWPAGYGLMLGCWVAVTLVALGAYVYGVYRWWAEVCFPCSADLEYRMNFALLVPTVPIFMAVVVETYVGLARQIAYGVLKSAFDVGWRCFFGNLYAISITVFICMFFWGVEVSAMWLQDDVPGVHPQALAVSVHATIGVVIMIVYMIQHNMPPHRVTIRASAPSSIPLADDNKRYLLSG